MPIDVKIGKLSPTMESGQIVRWLVKVGDAVKEGQTLAEVQTDKAVMNMESFDAGVVAHFDVAEGEEAQVGQRVLVLAKKGEDPKAVAEQASKSAPSSSKSSGGGSSAASKEKEKSETASPAPAAAGSGSNGHSPSASPASAPAPAVAAAAVAVAELPDRVKSSPLARKIAERAGLDIRLVPGSGPRGRVVRADVESYLANPPAAPAARAGGGAVAASAAAAPATERIPLSVMRKTIAKRMLASKQSAPDIHLVVDVDLDAVMAVREALNKSLAKDNVKLSVGDFVTKAVAVALRRHPEMNAWFEGDAIVRHGSVNVGIAVALEGGLIVPVLRDADRLGLLEIRKGTEALAKAARANKLTPDQLSGGTFTISNLGMFGIKQFDAILNIPEVGILAVGAAEPRAVVRDGQLAVATLMTVTLTADHRALDGADAARFLQTFKTLLEQPASMLL